MEDHAFDSSAFVGTGNTGVHGINRERAMSGDGRAVVVGRIDVSHQQWTFRTARSIIAAFTFCSASADNILMHKRAHGATVKLIWT